MVIGERMTGCVGAVGVGDHITARRSAAPGDLLIMTEGAGGGTIATTALYYGYTGVVDQTINLSFLRSADALVNDPVLTSVHAMTDVTNGGLRGDIHEMAETARARFVVEEEAVLGLVNPSVGTMLDELEIDPLGVSLDALLIVIPEAAAGPVMSLISHTGVKSAVIGRVEKGAPEPVLMRNGVETDFQPKFREAAYTPLKKLVEKQVPDFEGMKRAVDRAAKAAMEKKERMIHRLSR
jgi:hydrogenase expression/formation protein